MDRWAGLDEMKNRGRFRRHPVLRHEDGIRQNRLVLHDLNALHEVTDQGFPLRERPFHQELPEVRHVPLDLL